MDGEYDHVTLFNSAFKLLNCECCHNRKGTLSVVINSKYIIVRARETQKSFSGAVRDSNPFPSVENLHFPAMANYLLFIKKTEAVVWRCSVKKVFLKISQNSREKTYSRVSFLIKLLA